MPGPIFRRRVYTVEATELEQGSSYATTDLYMAAFFFCEGAQLVKTARQGRQVTFVFEAPTVHDLRMAWFKGSGNVLPKANVDALLNLKNIVRSS